MNTLEYHQLRSSYAEAWDLAVLEAAARAQDPSFPEVVRNLLPEPEEHFPDDPGASELTPLDVKLMQLCERYRAGGQDQQTFIRAMISRSHGRYLQGLSIRMATLAVSQNSAELVRLALLAHAVEDLAAGDVRDNLCMLAVVADAARRVGADPVALFQEAAAIAGPAMSHVLREYVARPGGIPSLSSMGYRAVDTPEGVRYRQVMWAPPSPLTSGGREG